MATKVTTTPGSTASDVSRRRFLQIAGASGAALLV